MAQYKAMFILLAIFTFSCENNSISERTSAMIQARQFMVDISGFRDENSGRYPSSVEELIRFLETANGFSPTNSHFVFNDRVRGLSENWIYCPPEGSKSVASVIFHSPNKVGGKFIIGLSSGRIVEDDSNSPSGLKAKN
jgi:hypothetical protein